MVWLYNESLMGYYCSNCDKPNKVYIHLKDWHKCPDCGMKLDKIDPGIYRIGILEEHNKRKKLQLSSFYGEMKTRRFK